MWALGYFFSSSGNGSEADEAIKSNIEGQEQTLEVETLECWNENAVYWR